MRMCLKSKIRVAHLLPRPTLIMPCVLCVLCVLCTLQGHTQAAPRMSERDLIAKMESHGIGTDATVAEHIQKQLDRFVMPHLS